MLEKTLAELELLLSDITFGGIRNLQPITLQKLDAIKLRMNELNMTEGTVAIEHFIHDFKLFREGKEPINIVIDSFCTLDFYRKTIVGNL